MIWSLIISYLFAQLFGVQKYYHKSMEINKTFVPLWLQRYFMWFGLLNMAGSASVLLANDQWRHAISRRTNANAVVSVWQINQQSYIAF
jgi:hypothetical protein